MQKILFYIKTSLPKHFTRKEFLLMIRQHSLTSHPDHYLQRLVEMGKLKHQGEGRYSY